MKVVIRITKSTYVDHLSHAMSFKYFTFLICEFLPTALYCGSLGEAVHVHKTYKGGAAAQIHIYPND